MSVTNKKIKGFDHITIILTSPTSSSWTLWGMFTFMLMLMVLESVEIWMLTPIPSQAYIVFSETKSAWSDCVRVQCTLVFKYAYMFYVYDT